MEIWKDIYFIENGIEWDYRGLYQISNYGNVKSLNYNKTRKERILKLNKDKGGYLYIGFSKNRKKKYFKIHRLVAYMFIDGYFENAQVNHKDENKENNHVSNLEWCTREYNQNYGTRNERARKSQSKSMKGKYTGKKHPNAKMVDRYDLNGNYIDTMCMAEYELIFGFKHNSISECCQFWEMNCDKDKWYKSHKGKPQKSHKGFIFKYHEKD